MTNIEALEELVEWGYVIIDYDSVFFFPSSRYRNRIKLSGEYGPDLLPELWDKVKETVR